MLLSCEVYDVDLAVGGAGGGLTGRELSGNLGVVVSVCFEGVLCVIVVAVDVESIG